MNQDAIDLKRKIIRWVMNQINAQDYPYYLAKPGIEFEERAMLVDWRLTVAHPAGQHATAHRGHRPLARRHRRARHPRSRDRYPRSETCHQLRNSSMDRLGGRHPRQLSARPATWSWHRFGPLENQKRSADQFS